MPELPEVETTRRGLEPVLGGQKIAHAGVYRDGLRWPFPVDMGARLTGATVTALRRRSKYLLIDLDSGETLIVHLGMSGSLQVALPKNQTARGKHDHVVLQLASGARVTFNDPRRFGAMDLCATEGLEAHKLLANIGPEPMGNQFDADHLAARLKGRRAPIKAALLDQRNVAGLGNIYVSEALWRAGISPRRQAGNLRQAQLDLLVVAIRDVLRDAIAAGGSTLRDFRHGEGELGYFQHRFAAYDREGEPCRKFDCTGTIARIVQSGRSSYYCTRCQR